MAGSIGFPASLPEPFGILEVSPRLAGAGLRYGVGVTTASVYEVKRVDSDYFADL